MQFSTFSRVALAAILLTALPLAQAPSVLRDLVDDPGEVLGSNPSAFTQLGNQVVFAATTAQDGRELWTIDPATGQASMVLDIAPGQASSSPHSLVVFAGFVYFSADDGVNGRELWRTDGTAAGTSTFVDLTQDGSSFSSEPTVVGNLLFFSAYTDAFGHELVVSDGTIAGTQVLDIVAGPEHCNPEGLIAIGSEVWFRAYTPATGIELWRSNGTIAGTVMAVELTPGALGSQPKSMQRLSNGNVVFLNDGTVWHSDGTQAGSHVLANGTTLTTIGNQIYFGNASSLLVSDGTPGNVQFVATLPPSGFGQITGLSTLGNRVIANAFFGIFPPIPQTFSSDGTAAGTQLLPQVVIGPIVVDGNIGWFRSTDAQSGSSTFGDAEIWQTDGTAAGTTLALQVPTTGTTGQPNDLVVLETPNRILFSAVDQLGREPWIYDPSQSTGQRLADLTTDNGVTLGSRPYELVDAAGTAFIGAVTSSTNPSARLYRSNGTEATTSELLPSGQNLPPYATDLITVGTKLFFRTYNPIDTYILWVSDGTEAGTTQLDLDGNTYVDEFVAAEDLLYFQCDDQFLRTNLWRTDGTQQGTFQVVPRPEWGGFSEIEPLGRGIVFRYQTFAMGSEPYYNDGTPTGTVLLQDLEPGSLSSQSTHLTTIGEHCFFGAFSGRLFVTDGTPAGTTELLVGATGLPTDIANLFAGREHLFFTGSTQTGGVGLWATDGTIAGTALIVELTASLAFNLIGRHFQFGDGMLVQASTDNGTALLYVDANAQSAVEVLRGWATSIVVTGERQAWFQGLDAAHGRELWTTDGTAAGTKLYADLVPGPESSSPRSLVFSGGRLMFSAEHPQLGSEPWVLDLHATSQTVGYGCTPTTSVPPQLWSDDPVRGTTMMVHIADGPEAGLGIPLISNYTTAVHPLGSGACDYFVDSGLQVLGFAITPGGMASIPLVIPNSPALDGARFRLQALTLPVSGLLQAELSNGVTLTIGQ